MIEVQRMDYQGRWGKDQGLGSQLENGVVIQEREDGFLILRSGCGIGKNNGII